ncbi:MAG TPA: hypothetical protein VGR32_00995 [Brevundimonas sp.]|uniref:hypothetical protein n=1 Tax=Brevundimonas sp. TaxID=1871086 RepID=UPI002DEBDF53|nr:hypothetical protein [Brevundimonas sp.]
MTVGTQLNTDFRDDGYEAWVEYRTTRQVADAWDSTNDDAETWAVNGGQEPLCIAFSQYQGVSGYWLLPPKSAVRLYRYATDGGTFSVERQSSNNADCSDWS